MTLVLLFAVPLAGALLLLRDGQPARLTGSGASLLSLVLSLVALVQAGQGHPLALQQAWAPAAGIGLTLRADGVSSVLLVVNAAVFLLAFAAVREGDYQRPRLLAGLMLVTQAGVAGVLSAQDLVLFYVFWEAVLIPLFFLIAAFGEGRRAYAGLKLLIYTGLGSLAMLLSILALFAAQASSGHSPSFALQDLAHVRLGHQPPFFGVTTADMIFLGFALAFAVKTPLFPLHGWLGDAYTSSPPPVVVVLAGVVSKLGPYGFYRVALGLLPPEARRASGYLMTLAAAGIIYGALLALRQSDSKRFVAYLSLSHMNFILLGVASLSVAGLSGGTLQMVNHGILIAALFLIIDHLQRTTGSRDRQQLAGLAARSPRLALIFILVVLATLGLPGLNGFAGEYLIMLGTYSRSALLLGIAAVGVVLAAWYMLRLHQGLMHGPRRYPANVELGPREVSLLAPGVALAVAIGVAPYALISLMAPSVMALARTLGAS